MFTVRIMVLELTGELFQFLILFLYDECYLPGTTSGLTRKLTQLTITNMKLGK